MQAQPTSSPSPHRRSAEKRAFPRVREAGFEDYPQVAQLEADYGLTVRPRNEWERLWTENPAYRAFGGRWPIGWILEHDGVTVGFFGNIPLTYYFGTRRLLATTGHAWVVRSEYRGYALLLLNYFIGQDGVDLFFNTTANREAAEAFAEVGAQRVPVGNWDEAGFWICDHLGFGVSLMRNKRVRRPTLSGTLVGAALEARDRLSWTKRVSAPAMPVGEVSEFDARFDEFWAELKKQNTGLMADRSRETLRWHYGYALRQRRAWIATIESGEHLLAYGVFSVENNANIGLTRIRFVDFAAVATPENCLRALLHWALARCRSRRVHMLETVGLSPCRGGIVASQVPHRRPLANWTYFYKANDPQLARDLQSPIAWDPSQYDGDASI